MVKHTVWILIISVGVERVDGEDVFQMSRFDRTEAVDGLVVDELEIKHEFNVYLLEELFDSKVLRRIGEVK